jgi:hypothetical protein
MILERAGKRAFSSKALAKWRSLGKVNGGAGSHEAGVPMKAAYPRKAAWKQTCQYRREGLRADICAIMPPARRAGLSPASSPTCQSPR